MSRYLHICPPWYVFYPGLRQPNVPLGAAYLARAAQDIGWEAAIWNGDLLPEGVENQFSEEMAGFNGYLATDQHAHPVWRELREVLLDYRPDIAGISVTTPAHQSALSAAKIIKEMLPECLVIAGGPHPSALPADLLNYPDIDAAIFGEGEITLGELLRNGKPHLMPGVVFRQNGEKCQGMQRSLVDLSSLGWPAKGAVIDKRGLLRQDHYGLMLFQRGCPYDCHFCGSRNIWTRKVRWRPARDVVDEMEAVHRQFDTRYFSFEDDTFTLNRAKTGELLDCLIESTLLTVPGFRWTCNTRPEKVNPALLDKMRQAGCAAVAIGIESGSPWLLRKMRKNFTVEDVRQAAQWIREAGLILSGQFMVGYPGETVMDMWDTVKLADGLECDSVMLSVATPLPGTPLFQEALDLQLITPSLDWTAVTTKNDGVLMTSRTQDGRVVPMPPDERRHIVAELHTAFGRIQAKTLAKKNESRQRYERQYLN